MANVICRAKPQNLSALILVTGQARNGEFIAETLRKQLNVPVEVKHNVEDMARLMSRADLAIGGGGISSWERCTLGLPSLVVLLADNQKEANHLLAKERCIFASVDPHELEEDLIGSFIDMDDSTYRTISCNAASACDGLDADRVIEALRG